MGWGEEDQVQEGVETVACFAIVSCANSLTDSLTNLCLLKSERRRKNIYWTCDNITQPAQTHGNSSP